MTYVIVLVAVLTRFLPHVPNFSPVFAALLFGGAHLKRRDSIWFPVALLAVSDVALTTLVYRMRLGWGQSITWLAFAVVALIGYWLRRRETVGKVAVAAFAGPTAFFFISNFQVWLAGHTVSHLYPLTWEGLVACYLAALPFYRNSVLSTLVYAALLFGASAMYQRKHSAIATTAQAG